MEFPNAEQVAHWLENEQNFVEFFYDNFTLVMNGDGNSAPGDAVEANAGQQQQQRQQQQQQQQQQQNRQVAIIPEVRRRRRNHRLLPYFCNMCQDYVRGGVITICGHLFCWTCLWADLHNRVLSRCPCCMRRLLLHEDIIPFLGEGPNAGPDDANIVAQPGNVPRPSGLYLEHHQYPSWFAVHNFEEPQYGGIQVVERNLSVIMHRMKSEYSRSTAWVKYLQWFQLACAAFLFYFWVHILSVVE